MKCKNFEVFEVVKENYLSEREMCIYNRLCDEESQLVFNKRKYFALTDDKTHFAEIFENRKQLADVVQKLKGSAEIIKRDNPKLAISIYHKKMNYVDIAEYICSLVSEYKLYMRHYTPMQFETVVCPGK